MKELFLGAVMIICSIIAIVLASVLLLIALSPIGYYYCSDYGEMSGLDTKFKVVTGECYVKHNGVWVEKDKLLGVHDVSR